jgi:hypothetical protein
MSETDEPDDDGLVYSVRPEPPRFDELIRRPALFNNDSPFRPPGPILRWFGSRRLRRLFQTAVVAGLIGVIMLILR